MLHIHNGDSTAGTLKEFGFPGEHKAFQEVLMEGPTPDTPGDEFRETRAQFLAEAYDIEIEKVKTDQRDQEAWLARISEHDETILWFEHDLFCQINLIYLLDWFSKRSPAPSKLSLICVDQFPGIEDFRGLGQLTGEQLASLFDKRHEVSQSKIALAARAWAAYRSPTPLELNSLVGEDTSAMPFLGHALRLHLMRFPSLENGLGRIEHKALELISDGAVVFKSLFPRFARNEPVYGIGDSQFWFALKRLSDATYPLITITEPADSGGSIRFHDALAELTEIGKAVLAGERDFIEINGANLWLGGVYLKDGAVWRWDQQRGLVASP